MIGGTVENEIETEGLITDLPDLAHSLHLLDNSIHRFFASIKPVLVIRVHETRCGIQNSINLVHMSVLLTITKISETVRDIKGK